MTQPMEQMKPGDALLLVDIQNDFCPGGALPIENGDQIIPVANDWIAEALKQNIPIYASRDWHPNRHISFKSEGGQWPPHCIQDTAGAAFHPDLKLPDSAVVITKGTRLDQDQNSVFDQTGFAHFLRREGIGRLWVAGLAQDVCVLATVLDARQAGIGVFVISEATRPVTADGGRKAMGEMKKIGANVV